MFLKCSIILKNCDCLLLCKKLETVNDRQRAIDNYTPIEQSNHEMCRQQQSNPNPIKKKKYKENNIAVARTKINLASFALIYVFGRGGGALATSIVEQNNDTIRNIFLLSLHYVIRRLALFKLH